MGERRIFACVAWWVRDPPRHADPATARPSRPAALRPRALRRRAVRARRDAAADARPPRPRLPRDPRPGRRDAARRLAHAGGRRPRAPATGTTAMEAGLANLLEPGETVIVGVAGFFGARLADMAERQGARVVRVHAPLGETVPNTALLDALDAHPEAHLVAVVHAETSTGAEHPLRELGEALAGYDALLMADCVTSLGGIPLDAEAWHSTTPTPARRSASAPRPAWRRSRSPRTRGRRSRAGARRCRSRSTCARCGPTGSTGPRPTTTPRRSSPSTRCTRRCGACSRRGSSRAGRATPRRRRRCGRRSRARAGAARRPAASSRR